MITIVFTSPKHWTLLSWLIKKFTKSESSHTAIGVDLHGIPVLIHSTMGGVQVTPRDKFLKTDYIVEEYKFIPDMSSGLKHAVSHLGENYDYVGIIGYAMLIVAWRWFKKKIKNPLASPKSLVCSEFVLHIDHAKQIKEWSDLDPERTTPQTLIEQCRSGSNFMKI